MGIFHLAIALGAGLMAVSGLAAESVAKQPPILFPHPMQMVEEAPPVAMGFVTVAVPRGEERLKEAAEAWGRPMAKWSGMPVHISFGPVDPAKAEMIGEQGYTLVVRPVDTATSVDIQANSEQGRFHGLQTLKQLVEDGKLHVVQIVDRPTLSRRGVPAGGWWWRNRERQIPLYASLKFNYIYAGGEMVDGKLGGPAMKSLWRQPFTEKELQDLRACRELAHRNFIDISVQMCPRGEPPVTYCSDEDINLTVGKLVALYDIGYRKFGVNFDDLQNIGQNKIVTQADKARFGEGLGALGGAHRYFVEQVYSRLKKGHPDIEFSFCPYVYSGFRRLEDGRKEYVQAIGKLPKEIQLVTCPDSEAELATVSELTGRPQLIWDNQIADRGGTFVGPLQRTEKYTDRDVRGYLTLLSQGDPFQVGYRSMADYMWSPERYSPAAAEQATLVKVLGSDQAAEAVKLYRGAISRLAEMKYSLTDKDARHAAMRSDLEVVKQATAAMEKIVPQKAYAEAQQQTASLTQMVDSLKARMDSQPFPVRVPRVAPGSVVVGSAPSATPSAEWSKAVVLRDFLTLRGGISAPAEAQTNVSFLHDGQNVLARFVCQEPNPAGIVAKIRASDEPVYTDDCVELFFVTSPQGDAIRQIVVNTLGTPFGGVKCTVGASVGEKQWVAEFSIPFESLGVKAPTGVWRFNACRSRYQVKGDAHMTWAPLYNRNFSAPEKFWPMIFE